MELYVQIGYVPYTLEIRIFNEKLEKTSGLTQYRVIDYDEKNEEKTEKIEKRENEREKTEKTQKKNRTILVCLKGP